MKNNIILKGMFLLALCVAYTMDAKTLGKGEQQPVVQQNVQVVTPKLSQAAESLLEESARYNLNSAALKDRFQERERKGIKFTDYDLRTINAEIKRLSKEEKRSSIAKQQSAKEKSSQEKNAEIIALKDTIAELRQIIVMQNKQNRGFLESMYDYMTTAGQYLGAGGLGASAVWYSVAAATTGGMAAGAAAAVGLMSGFKYLAAKAQSGELSEYMRSLMGENLIAQAVKDGAKYPTKNAELEGIRQDMKNTGLIDENTFKSYCDKVYNAVTKERDELYAANKDLKNDEEKIDSKIRVIRGNYRTEYQQGAQAYADKLETITNISDITMARAVLSEYLRACFRVQQEEAYAQAKKEQAEKEAEAKSQATSPWWSWMR